MENRLEREVPKRAASGVQRIAREEPGAERLEATSEWAGQALGPDAIHHHQNGHSRASSR